MNVLSWLDTRTLLACDFMLAVAFAIVFFSLKRTYPVLRGINTIAISFLLGVPGSFLMASRGLIPRFLSVTVANCFVLSSFVFLYRGILRFVGSRKSALLPVGISCLAVVVLFYFSEIQERMIPRIIALSMTVGIVRGMIALELFRKSPSFPSPTTMRLFAACMSFFAAVTVNGGLITILRGVHAPLALDTNEVGSATIFFGVIAACATGLFVLTLSNGELLARSRDEASKDSLSGVLNRRGIEAKLAAELKHLKRGRAGLSIALIDLDHFKSINDVQGHAAGDSAIRDVASVISTHLRSRDHLGRYGGDEFLLILPQTPSAVALAVTDRLNRAVRSLTDWEGSPPLTLSIGLTEATLEDDAVSLIARADKALYQAKSDGRNCGRVLTAQTEAADQGSLTLAEIMTSAVESSAFQR